MPKMEKGPLFLLLILIPSQLGYHFWPDWSLVNGIRVDYLSPTLYLTDLLIGWLMLNNRNKFRLSIWVIVVAVLNTAVATNPLVTIYHWLRAYEYYWLYRYLVLKRALRISRQGLSVALIWTAILTWVQFLLQRSVGGWLYWLGERSFNLATPAIAKVFIPSLGMVLRPYATMAHPNALAGWLLVAGLVTDSWSRIASWLTIPITFSRTAIVLLPLQLWRKSKLLSLLLVALGFFLLAKLGNPTSSSERVALMVQATEVILRFPVGGVGWGNFVYWVPTIRQPVHNIYLLAMAQLGIPATLWILLKLIRWLKSVSRWNLALAVMGILITGMVDHYWLTLHQNILLLVVLLALVKMSASESDYKL